MGLFSWLTGTNEDNLEQVLLRDYTASSKLAGMSHQEAASQALAIVEAAKKAVVEWGWDRLPPQYGDCFLEQTLSNTEYGAALQRLRKDGVRDDDIRVWLNMPPLDRAANIKAHELDCTAAFLELVQRGDSPDVAASKVRKVQPHFGLTTDGVGDDRPIPWELRRRITKFMEKYYHDLNTLRQMIETSTSFNALVRQQIRLGKL